MEALNVSRFMEEPSRTVTYHVSVTEILIGTNTHLIGRRSVTDPVMRALRRVLPAGQYGESSGRSVTILESLGERVIGWADFPPDVIEKIMLLDAGLPVEPFEFDLVVSYV